MSESLVVLTQDGTYRLYSLTPNPSSPTSTTASSSANPPPLPNYTQHSLGPDAQEAGVLEAKIYEDGMVVLLGNLSFVEVRAWQRPGASGGGGGGEGDGGDGSGVGVGGKVQTLPSPGLTEPPDCWAVIIPELSHTRGVEVLIGVGETVLRLDEIEVIDQVRLLVLSGPARWILILVGRIARISRTVYIYHSFSQRSLPRSPLSPLQLESTTLGRFVRFHSIPLRV